MKKLIATTLAGTGLIVGTGVVDDLFFAPQAHAQWCNDGTFDHSGDCIAHEGELGGPIMKPCGLIQLAMHDPCWGGLGDPPAPLFFTGQLLSQDSSAQLSNVAHRQIVVSCPADLERLVDQTERCTFDDQGRGWWLDASVVPAGPGIVTTHYQVQPGWTP
ncbi:hypothetical protein M2432_005210 [Mycobacterium sp. OTB74]|nr:hypothetical protein [Mycobacterium sp. OTB74]